MGWASRSGRARTSSRSPQAFGVCQRCGIWYNRVDLRNQYAWRGAALLPTWIFVCDRCMDVPQEQDRAIILSADPIPVQLALPEMFDDKDQVMGLTDGSTVDPITNIPIPGKTAMGTTDGVVMSPTPIGRPPGYALQTVMPLAMDDEGVSMPAGIPIPVTSMMADGSPLVRVTCSSPHNLALNSQIAVQGSGDPHADGMFSVTPTTATAFTYGCYDPIPAGSLLEPATMLTLVVSV